jgi:hypothetical protein
MTITLDDDNNTNQFYAWFLQDPETKDWTIPGMITPEGPLPMVCNEYRVAMKMEKLLEPLREHGLNMRLVKFSGCETVVEIQGNPKARPGEIRSITIPLDNDTGSSMEEMIKEVLGGVVPDAFGGKGPGEVH